MLRMKKLSDDRGMALLVAMIFLVMMGILATWATTRVMDNTRHVDKYVDYQNTFEGLEAGFAEAEVELNADGDGIVGIDPDYDWGQGYPAWTDPAVVPLTMTTRPEIQYFTYTLDWATDGIDNNGDGDIDMGVETSGYFSTYSFARAFRNNNATAIRAGEQISQGSNVNIWQNAIFAGTGQAGNLINGNVAIHGSVHLLGDALGAGGVAIAALDMSGTSLIHNNYDGITTDLKNRVPALPTTTVNGETVQTLNAKLRVKHGLVGLSGNSEIGSPNVAGNTSKEKMDGIYVSDGWTGNQLNASGDPLHVYSDNGWDDGYELGNAVPFPTYSNDSGRNHLNYYLETSGSASSGLNYVYQGNMTIKPSGGNFYWDATTNTTVVNKNPGVGGMPTEAGLNNNHYYIWFNDATDTMIINGRIPVNGDISLIAGNGAGNRLINYKGKGSLLAYKATTGNANVTISASLKTTAFPNTNLLGVQAQNNMSIGTSAQMEMMGGFYAQNTISVNKQTTIMGTIVGNNFDMGSNVPEIYQVPALANAWTSNMRMIGAGPVWFLEPVSWRELAVL